MPKATQKYLEAEETLFQELEENLIGYRRKFQFESTRNWRFDFYIVQLNLLIEIVGSPWAVGRGGKKIANSFNKYNLAEGMGYKIERFDPHMTESGQVIYGIKSKLERLDDGTDPTICSMRFVLNSMKDLRIFQLQIKLSTLKSFNQFMKIILRIKLCEPRS